MAISLYDDDGLLYESWDPSDEYYVDDLEECQDTWTDDEPDALFGDPLEVENEI
jgi:hypothetical protein